MVHNPGGDWNPGWGGRPNRKTFSETSHRHRWYLSPDLKSLVVFHQGLVVWWNGPNLRVPGEETSTQREHREDRQHINFENQLMSLFPRCVWRCFPFSRACFWNIPFSQPLPRVGSLEGRIRKEKEIFTTHSSVSEKRQADRNETRTWFRMFRRSKLLFLGWVFGCHEI